MKEHFSKLKHLFSYDGSNKKQNQNLNSTHFTSMRGQEDNLFKELKEIHHKFLTLLMALVAATNTDTGNSLFTEHYVLIMSLLVAIVLYSFLATVGTILHVHYTKLLPIITCAMFMFGSVVSVLALTLISTTVAWITLGMWVGMFMIFAYDHGVPQRIKDWIEGCIERS